MPKLSLIVILVGLVVSALLVLHQLMQLTLLCSPGHGWQEERPRPSFGGGRYGGAGGGGYGGPGGGYGVADGYSGGGYGGSGGYGSSNRNNLGGHGGGNHNVAGGENLFSGGLGGASGASPGGGNEGDNLTEDLAGKGGDDFEEDDYANTPTSEQGSKHIGLRLP